MTNIKEFQTIRKKRYGRLHRDDLPERIKLYEIVFNKFNQEGDGIWRRFNIMFGINVALFGGLLYLYNLKTRPMKWREIGLGISFCGLFLSVWATHVLNGLWKCHRHWRDMLMQIELSFPKGKDGWVRPNRQQPIIWTNHPKPQKWRLPYTQPFFLAAMFSWGILIFLLALKIFQNLGYIKTWSG